MGSRTPTGKVDELEVLAKMKQHIRDSGLTQGIIADQLGVSPGHLSQMLMGLKSFKLSHLLKLLQIAQIDPQIFVAEGHRVSKPIAPEPPPAPKPYADFKHPIIGARLWEKFRLADNLDAKLLTLVEAYLDGIIAQRKCQTRRRKNKK